jgi:ABC-type polysaccharide/polyol phosphate transport system ATPase subunit
MNIIELENIGKKYILKHEKGTFIKDVIPRLFIPKEEKEFWALRGINLTLNNGESLGIIGRNGAGKSTFLNIIAGISSPTEGKVKIKGRISTLLTLGAGFHPELTGEDNIYLNGVILGLKIREIKEQIRAIIEFSELKDFIKQPLYTYSSGMILRLGFSIAIHIDFDILLMDEILAVGDFAFQEKCLNKINDFRKDGKTLVIASQSLDLIKSLCHKVLLLEKGNAVLLDEPVKTINRYMEIIKESQTRNPQTSQYPYYPKYPEDLERIKSGWGTRMGTGQARILEVKLRGTNGEERNLFRHGESLRVEIKYIVEREIRDPHFGVAIFREDYIYCYGPNTAFDGIRIKRLKRGIGYFSIIYKNLTLNEGNYRLTIAIWDKDEENPYDYHYAYYKFKIFGEGMKSGPLLSIPCNLFIDNKQAQEAVSFSLEKIKDKSGRDNFAEIKKPKILGRWGREKNIFLLKENLKFLFSIKVLRKIESPLIWMDIQNQNLLIQEACFKIKEDLSPGMRKLFLDYPEVPLLKGSYSLSLGIGSENEKESFQYFPKLTDWELQATKKDHGIVCLPHKWIIKNPKG